MNVHATRLSMVLALMCLIGGPIPSSVASAQDPDVMDLNFDDDSANFDPKVANEVAAEEAKEMAKSLAPYFVAGGLVLFVFWLLVFIGAWKVFTKAGKPGWAIIVPIYNAIVVLEICGRPIWWIFLLMIPFVNFVISLIVSLDLAKSFGRGPLFGIGLAFFGCIFVPVLGFGSAQYKGPAAT